MPLPTAVTNWGDPLDPTDLVEREMDLRPLLEAGQSIASYTLAVLPEAALLGLTIVSTGARAPYLVDGDRRVRLSLEIAEAQREDPAFQAGVTLGVAVTFLTSGAVSDRRQRTFAAKVIQL